MLRQHVYWWTMYLTYAVTTTSRPLFGACVVTLQCAQQHLARSLNFTLSVCSMQAAIFYQNNESKQMQQSTCELLVVCHVCPVAFALLQCLYHQTYASMLYRMCLACRWAWCLPCGFGSIIPYFYVIYFAVLLGMSLCCAARPACLPILTAVC